MNINGAFLVRTPVVCLSTNVPFINSSVTLLRITMVPVAGNLRTPGLVENHGLSTIQVSRISNDRNTHITCTRRESKNKPMNFVEHSL